MNTTSNYGLKEPLQTEFYNVDDFNYNSEIIDAEMFRLSTEKQGVLSTSQMNAVNSGITSAKVSKLDALPTASELEDEIASARGTELTATLTAGQTTLTFTDSSITANSTVDVYTSVYGVSPTEITSGTGSLTLTFDSQDSDLSVKVVIK